MTDHRIKRITLDLTVGDEPLAHHLLARDRGTLPDRIAPALDRVCTALGGSGRVDRIDRIELDLGVIPLEDFDAELTRRLEPAFHAALLKILNLGDRGPAAPTASAIDLLEIFARTGNLPWTADPTREEPVAAALRLALDAAPGALTGLLRGLADDPQALARLARHCDDAARRDALTLIQSAGLDPALTLELRRGLTGASTDRPPPLHAREDRPTAADPSRTASTAAAPISEDPAARPLASDAARAARPPTALAQPPVPRDDLVARTLAALRAVLADTPRADLRAALADETLDLEAVLATLGALFPGRTSPAPDLRPSPEHVPATRTSPVPGDMSEAPSKNIDRAPDTAIDRAADTAVAPISGDPTAHLLAADAARPPTTRAQPPVTRDDLVTRTLAALRTTLENPPLADLRTPLANPPLTDLENLPLTDLRTARADETLDLEAVLAALSALLADHASPGADLRDRSSEVGPAPTTSPVPDDMSEEPSPHFTNNPPASRTATPTSHDLTLTDGPVTPTASAQPPAALALADGSIASTASTQPSAALALADGPATSTASTTPSAALALADGFVTPTASATSSAALALANGPATSIASTAPPTALTLTDGPATPTASTTSSAALALADGPATSIASTAPPTALTLTDGPATPTASIAPPAALTPLARALAALHALRLRPSAPVPEDSPRSPAPIAGPPDPAAHDILAPPPITPPPPVRPRASPPPRAVARARSEALARLDELYVEDAGLVLLWPFYERLFRRVGLTDDERRFVDEPARVQAVVLLELLATADPEPLEYRLPLAKVLCGVPLTGDFAPQVPLAPELHDECARLLAAVRDHVPDLGDISAAGLRSAFLQRRAALRVRDGAWLLQVERKPHDLLLERFPWSWSWVKLAWMPDPMRVEW